MTHIDMNFFSAALCRRQRLRVFLPDPGTEAPQGGLAVLYLLHGFSDGCDSVLHNSAFARYCDGLPLCVVMPDAEKSFYADMRCGGKYWTHIFVEVPALVAATFPVNTAPEKTFVGGISMGGYGAAKWMLQAPVPCAHIFLLSPVTDIVRLHRQGLSPGAPFAKEQFRLDAIFDGPHLAGGNDDLFALLHGRQARIAPVSLYCGTEDFLYDDVRVFARALREKGVPLRDIETPGEHCWQTWEGYLQDMARVLRETL